MIRKNALLSLLVLVLSFSVFSFSRTAEKKKRPSLPLSAGPLSTELALPLSRMPCPHSGRQDQGRWTGGPGQGPGRRAGRRQGKFILPGFIDCHIHTFYPHPDAGLHGDELPGTPFAPSTSWGDVRQDRRDVHPRRRLARRGHAGPPPAVSSSVTSTAGRLFACGTGMTVTGGHGDG